MNQLGRLIGSQAFHAQPARTIINALRYVAVSLVRKQVTIAVDINETVFRMSLFLGGRQSGAAGIYVFRQWYEPLLLYLANYVKPNMTAIDAGANQGIFSLAMSQLVGRQGTVLSVEPQAYAVDQLSYNFKTFGCSKFHIEASALSNTAGFASLDLSIGPVSASIASDQCSNELVRVPTVSLDELVTKYDLDRVDFVKMDIQGAEMKAIQGATRTIARHRPTIVLECEEPEQFGPACKKLEALGYQGGFLQWNGNLEPLTDENLQRHPNVVFESRT